LPDNTAPYHERDDTVNVRSRIEEVGEGVSEGFAVGDRVCVQPIIYDGTCGSCEEGLVNCCDNNGFVGLSGKLVVLQITADMC
jgi:threonine dehydrogenase-like Zn-dependent dehydrogenase